jgi:hypothetical protein
MLVNVSKTVLLQLVKGRPLPADIKLPLSHASQPIRVDKAGAKYLGLFVAPDRGVRDAPNDLCQRAHRAWLAMLRKLPNLQCHPSISLRIRIYWTIVRPVLLYGAEVWSVLPGGDSKRRQLYSAFHRHLTRLCHVPVSVSGDALCMALHILPLQGDASLRAVRFWHDMWNRPQGSFYKHVVLDSWRDLCIDGVKNYAYGMLEYLSSLGCVEPTRTLTTPATVPVSTVIEALSNKQSAVFSAFPASPHDAPSCGVTLCTYVRFHHILPHEPLLPLFHLPLSMKACAVLLKFMLGASPLPLHAGRRTCVARERRHCPLCDMGVLADEYHMIFVCPALHALRANRPALFARFTSSAWRHVQHFMRHPDRFAVAGFLLQALRHYQLSVTVPVGSD